MGLYGGGNWGTDYHGWMDHNEIKRELSSRWLGISPFRPPNYNSWIACLCDIKLTVDCLVCISIQLKDIAYIGLRDVDPIEQ